jgi:hypothetical protein
MEQPFPALHLNQPATPFICGPANNGLVRFVLHMWRGSKSRKCLKLITDLWIKYLTEMEYIGGISCVDIHRFVKAYCHLQEMDASRQKTCFSLGGL